jgi:hypothetical protein
MNASIFPENGEWLLVLDPAEPDHTASEIAETLTPASAFEKCWTGESWADAPGDYQRFESKKEAATYLHDHWQQMESLATALHVPALPVFPIRGL